MRFIPQYRHEPSNLQDQVESIAVGACAAALARVELRRACSGAADASILLRDPGPEAQRAAHAVKERLAGDVRFHSIRCAGQRVTLRFADELLAATGRELQRGATPCAPQAGSFAGARYLVGCCDPNTTKALHVGHLRNVALGKSIAAALAAAGAHVTSLSIVGDIGRNVCEALAGWMQLGLEHDPDSERLKPDVFVGRCYARYVAALAAEDVAVAPLDAPIAREVQRRTDLAQTLTERWMRGDPSTRAAWTRLRGWALEGQAQTLRNLGLVFDREVYESDTFARGAELVACGLAHGLFRREQGGAVVYDTGKREYPTLPLVRSDGFPTEHLRGIAIWSDLQRDTTGVDGCIHVLGDEWIPAETCLEEVVAALVPGTLLGVCHKLSHAMVTLAGSKMKSSGGDALLIDDLLARLVEDDELARIAASSDGAVAPAELAPMIALACFLMRPAHERIEFSWESFADPRKNRGWLLARAWSKASRAAAPAGDADPRDPAYRFSVLQSQRLRRQIHLAAASCDVADVLRLLAHLCAWFLDAPADARVARVVRTTLRAGLQGVGLLDAPRA